MPPAAGAARAVLLATAVAALAVLGWLGASAVLVASTLEPAEHTAVAAALGPRAALLFMMVAVGVAALAAALRWAHTRWVLAPVQAHERSLLAQQRRLEAELAARVAEGSLHVEQERARLAALMAELSHSVVVCNLDGRVLLYNQRARLQFQALAPEPGDAGGAAMIGLGRSIHSVIDRSLLDHALGTLRRRLARGAPQPSVQFVTVTAGGQLLRAQMAAVRNDAGANGHATRSAEPAGYVLLLDNVTREVERATAQDQLLQDLTEGSRASLGNLQAAVELLDAPDLEPAIRNRFLGVVRDEARAMAQRLHTLSARTLQDIKTRWPLDDMLGSDLVAAVQRRLEARRLRAGVLELDGALWLQVDGHALTQALCHLVQRLHEDFGVGQVLLRLRAKGGRAQLDLVWPALPMSTETVMAWETEPMSSGSTHSPLSVRDVVERHDGAFWFERDRAHQQQFLRFLLPLADGHGDTVAAAGPAGTADERPEFYDFDLFRQTDSTHALDDQPLASLRYTVFDTETTGLEPSAGDEIIQIGAVRVVNGRLLRQECMDQLVDPQRHIPEAGIPIHHITPEMVRGKPTIARVLPAFHAFAADTVLVAHNAAFDMRFLQLKEAATGLRFDQPVLDTLLLSALVHPKQDSHKLDAIAERLGVPVVGRHTALGDALITGEVFLKLLPLLAAMGIATLGQAREAAQKTCFARITY